MDGRGESDRARLTRNMGELLQELRVVQAGVQILFAFLLAVAFTARFATATTFQRTTMIVTILLTVVSTVLLMALPAWHRLYFQQHRRMDLIRWGNRFAITGLACLAAAMTGAVLLVSDVVLGFAAGVTIAAFVAALFGAVWFVVPLARRATAPVDDEEN